MRLCGDGRQQMRLVRPPATVGGRSARTQIGGALVEHRAESFLHVMYIELDRRVGSSVLGIVSSSRSLQDGGAIPVESTA